MKAPPLLLALATLAACSRPAPEEPDASALASSAAEAAAVASAETMPSGTPAVPAATPTAAPLPATPEAPSESRDPAKVVVAWAKTMSLKQWGSGYLYWGDHGARSGMTAAQFAAKWGKLTNPEFELHKGTSEGAAGSLYYTAPIVLIDGKRHVAGEIVLRRVNDVEGASAEQLRWHIESLTIAP